MNNTNYKFLLAQKNKKGGLKWKRLLILIELKF